MLESVALRFICLKILLVCSCFIAGKLMSRSRNNSQYWRAALIVILCFCVVEGLRFGRLIDWNAYYINYQEIGLGTSKKNFEPLFSVICKTLYSLGVPYWGFIALQCSFLMYSCCLLFKRYYKCAMWILPPVIYLLYMNENFIRWYLAASFLFVSIYYLLENKKKISIVFFACSILCHSGMIAFVPLFFLCNFIDRRPINRKIAVVLFILFTFFLSIQQLHLLVYFSSFLSKMGLGNLGHVGGYLNAASDLINGRGAADLGFSHRSFTNQIRLLLEYLPVIWLAPKFVKNYRYGVLCYNLFVIGAILDPVFNMVEIMGRISGIFLFFSSVVGGIVYYHTITCRESSKSLRCICCMSFFCGVWPAISVIFASNSFYEMTYIWDSGNLDYLPVIYFR